jgi:PAS domain-containing protein
MAPPPPWESWFQPATRLINRLKYPQKFALLSFVLLLPLALALYLLLSEIQGQINFATKELEGLHYLQALEPFQQGLLQPTPTGTVSSTDPEILAAWQGLQQAEETWGPRLKTDAQFQILEQYWQTPAASQPRKYRLLDALAKLRTQVGDQSNLILDPDLDSYYLMDAILLRLPRIQVDLAAVVDLAPVKNLSPLQRAQLVTWGEQIEQANQALQTYATVAFEHNLDGQLRPRLENHLRAFGEELDPVTRRLARFADPQDTPSLPDLERQAQQALQSSFPVWQKTSTELERLLQQRIQRFRYRQWSLSLFVLFTLAIALYLFIGFYRSVMQTVESLSQAARRMVDGRQTQAVQLQTQDEMAMVIHSFNTVADALRLAEAKYRSIVENAVEGIYQTTVAGQYLMVNPMLAQIYGYDSPAALIQHFSNRPVAL